VHDRKRVTSHGGASSFDPAMYLVDHLYGEEAAKGVAKGMVITWPPPWHANHGVVIEPTDQSE